MRKIHNKKRKFILRNNRAVTEMVAYVLLVMIALILSIMVYGFLKLYVLKPSPVCREGISIAIDDYVCNAGSKEINITFKNTGRWDIEGFFIRANNRTEGDAVYPLISPGVSVGERVYLNDKLEIGQKLSLVFVYSELGNITKITVQPFMANKTLVSCSEAKITQEISRCGEVSLITCNDGIKNQDESDVDCGGTNCGGCDLGKDCMRNMDCLTGYCDSVSGTCQNAPPGGPVIPSSLVSWWKFEGNGYDERGVNNLILTPGTSYDVGNVGKALKVILNTQYATNSTPISSLQFAGDFTIEALVKLNVIPTTNTAYVIGDLSGANPNYGLRISKDGEVIFEYAKKTIITSSKNLISAETWYYIAAVKSGNNFKLFINEQSPLTGTSTDTVTYSNDVLYIGSIINGMTDEVAIYNSFLSQEDISKHSQNALARKNYFST